MTVTESLGRDLLPYLLPVIDLPGFMQDLPEGNGLSVLLDIFQPSRTAVGQHEVGFGNMEFLLFLFWFHCPKSKVALANIDKINSSIKDKGEFSLSVY